MKSTVGCASRRLTSAQFEPESAGVPLPAVCTTTISIHRCSTSAGIINDTTNTESNNHSSNSNQYQWYYSSEASIPNTKSTALSWRSRHCNSLKKSSSTLWGSMTPTTTTTSSKTMVPRCEVCERLQGWSTSSDETVATTRENVGSVREKEHVRDSRVDHATLQSLRTFDRRIVRRGVISRSASCVVRWYSRVEMLLGKRSSLVRWTRQEGQAFAWTILFLLLLASPASSAGSHKELSDGSSKAGGVCQSIDVRNSVRFFSRLQGCRIVEGFVQILLIDNAEPSQYANISFPELTEITGYLLLYRVNGLRSIGHLFPNLTVIRGHSLFTNYALVAFEMMNLQEIGLHSLTSIARGAVRFEKNPALCYVDTIDWDLIAKAGRDENVIAGNNPKNGCPVCEKNCPRRSTKREETLCWNQQYCQRRCESKCENNACDAEGTCCHHLCLGTCTGPTARDCAVCRDVITPENECKERCPDGSFEFMNRRCVSEQQCRQMAKPREAFNTKAFPYKPFNGSCVIECPPGYTEEDVNGKASCKKCEGPCSKECPGASVDSIASAQKLRGCTHITGSLEIQIRGGKNIVKELEENLSSIEEIDGYLKIVRSFSLISLNFLKNLRVIRGNDSENSKHTLTVLDNQNLQELWDWRWHPEIKILSKGGGAGRVFFHLNPKLCLYKIETLREKAGLSPFTDLEVSPNSNGDKVACNVTELRTRVSTKSPWGAVIEWEPFVHHDARSLLGYVVYFIEAPHENVTMYDGRDACGGDGWKVDDVTASTNISLFDSNQKARSSESHYLSLLKPYTQYAYYVKTYTIATERSGAQSKLTYFRTLPEAPSAPRSLSTWSNSSSELVISWFPPLNKNGNLTHYLISGRWEREDANFIDQRNYCDEPMLLPDKKALSAAQEEERKRAEEEKEQTTVSEGGSCECGSRETDRSMRENEVSSSIAFEDALHNQVYVKRKSARRKRQVREMTTMSTMAAVVAAGRKAAAYNADQPIPDKIVNGTYEKFGRIVPSTNLSFVMRNLRHFSTYNIEVQACRAPEVNDTFDRCSSKSVRAFRTLPMESADNIPPDTFKLSVSGENNSIPTVTLRWDEPPEPNGLIVTYQIEYKKVDTQDSTVRCITRREFTKKGNAYHLIDIPPGNYTVKVRAGSLAGYGAYTQAKYFYIEERKTLSTSWVVFWSVFCFAVFVISFVACFFFCKQKLMRNVPNVTLIAEVNPEYVSMPYVLDEWEVPREKIQILTSLGNGSFGMVYEGVAKDIVKGKPEVRCAVKTVNKNATDRERIEFLNEASVMKGFDAHHVVKLLGVVTRGQPTLVIMELMVNGDLKKYLRTHRPGTCDSVTSIPPNLERILQMAIEIADGMAYLQTKKFVHRDLAARNCMVAEDLTVKIGDFGMTRDIYEKDYYRKSSKGLLPVRWMAPESLKDGEFSSYSDVWSYGVVLWEMVTFASQPYQGLSNDQVLRYVMDGGVMQRPENCPELLYKLMEYTWKHKASARPSFLEITRMLLDHVNVEPFKQVSFYHSTEGMEARKHLNLDTVHDLPEDDIDGEEESTLSPRSRLDPYTENSKSPSNCHDMNSSNAASKSGFFSGLLGTPRLSKNRGKPDYENRSLDELSYAEKRETEPLRQDFSSLDAVKSETLNNGYIGGTTT